MLLIRGLARRAGGALLVAVAASPGCFKHCDEPYDRSGAEATIASFHRAMRCDDREAEYACFSTRIKRSFGAFSAYSIAREVLREQHSVALRFISQASLDRHVKVAIDDGGN